MLAIKVLDISHFSENLFPKLSALDSVGSVVYNRDIL